MWEMQFTIIADVSQCKIEFKFFNSSFLDLRTPYLQNDRNTETQKDSLTEWQKDRKTDKKRERRNNKQMEREKEWMTTRRNLKLIERNMMLASHWSIFVISIYWVLNKLCNKCLHQLHEIIFNKLTNDTAWACICI